LAIAFSEKAEVIGYDKNSAKIQKYKSGIDPTNEVGDEAVKACGVRFTDVEEDIRDARFFIVAVPSPINMDKTPDLSSIKDAGRMIGRNIKKGAVVVYESTVYPGVTEEICVPAIEAVSGLKAGMDFKMGYSPERINPGDKAHRLENIVKIVSGQDAEALDIVADLYERIIEAGVHRAESIKVAEAAKVAENSQRDINIAFMNELSIVFDRMNISTRAVLSAMRTKWNALHFVPGLVGGHCIGIDPYYFIYKAESLGYHSHIILNGRRINDDMGFYVAENAIKHLARAKKPFCDANVAVLGLTFKENCSDIRNSRIKHVIGRMEDFGISPKLVDPLADPDEIRRIYGRSLTKLEDLSNLDMIIVAAPHREFDDVPMDEWVKLFGGGSMDGKVFMDIKVMRNGSDFAKRGIRYWSLL
jgi:UDP-N-acetyl-D-galactosamine dehydrogenase